jgi:hypothetical protein
VYLQTDHFENTDAEEEYYSFTDRIKSLRAMLPAEILYWGF